MPHNLCHAHIPLSFILGWSRDDERRAGFVNQHIVDFVDDGIVMTTLDAFIQAHGHVITQVVKTKFGVGAIGDVCSIGFFARYHAQLVLVFVRRLFLQIDQESFFAIFGTRSHLQNADG